MQRCYCSIKRFIVFVLTVSLVAGGSATAPAKDPPVPQLSWGQVRVLENPLELDDAGLLTEFKERESRGEFIAVEQKESVYEFQILLDRALDKDLKVRLSLGGEAVRDIDYVTSGLQHSERIEKSPNQLAYLTILANEKEARFSVVIKNNWIVDKQAIDKKHLKQVKIAVAPADNVNAYNSFYASRPRVISILDDDRWQWADVQITPSGGSTGKVSDSSKNPAIGDVRLAYSEKVISACDQNSRKPKISLVVNQEKILEKYKRKGLAAEWSTSGSTFSSNAEVNLGISQSNGQLLYDRDASSGFAGCASDISCFKIKTLPLTLADGTVVSVPHFQVKIESLVFVGGEVRKQASGGLDFLKTEDDGCFRRCVAMVSGSVTVVQKPVDEILAERAWDQK